MGLTVYLESMRLAMLTRKMVRFRTTWFGFWNGLTAWSLARGSASDSGWEHAPNLLVT